MIEGDVISIEYDGWSPQEACQVTQEYFREMKKLIQVLPDKYGFYYNLSYSLHKRGVILYVIEESDPLPKDLGGYRGYKDGRIVIGFRNQFFIEDTIVILLHEIGHYFSLLQYAKHLKVKTFRGYFLEKVPFSMECVPSSSLDEGFVSKKKEEIRAWKFALRILKIKLVLSGGKQMLSILKSTPAEKVERAHISIKRTIEDIKKIKDEIVDLRRQRADELIDLADCQQNEGDEVLPAQKAREGKIQAKILQLKSKLEEEELILNELLKRKISLIEECFEKEHQERQVEMSKKYQEKVKVDEKISAIRGELDRLVMQSNRLELESMRITRPREMKYHYSLNIEKLNEMIEDPFFPINPIEVSEIISAYEGKARSVQSIGNAPMLGRNLWRGNIDIWIDEQGKVTEYEIG